MRDYITTAFKVIVGLLTPDKIVLLALIGLGILFVWQLFSLSASFHAKLAKKCRKISKFMTTKGLSADNYNNFLALIAKMPQEFIRGYKTFEHASYGLPSDYIKRFDSIDVEVNGGMFNHGKSILKSFIYMWTILLTVLSLALMGETTSLTGYALADAILVPVLFCILAKIMYYIFVAIRQQQYRVAVDEFNEMLDIMNDKMENNDNVPGPDFLAKAYSEVEDKQEYESAPMSDIVEDDNVKDFNEIQPTNVPVEMEEIEENKSDLEYMPIEQVQTETGVNQINSVVEDDWIPLQKTENESPVNNTIAQDYKFSDEEEVKEVEKTVIEEVIQPIQEDINLTIEEPIKNEFTAEDLNIPEQEPQVTEQVTEFNEYETEIEDVSVAEESNVEEVELSVQEITEQEEPIEQSKETEQSVVEEIPVLKEQPEEVVEESSVIQENEEIKEDENSIEEKIEQIAPAEQKVEAKENKEQEVEQVQEVKRGRGRPKKIAEADLVITNDKEFEEALERAEKLMRKSEEALSASQAKRVEKALKDLLDAMTKYKEQN